MPPVSFAAASDPAPRSALPIGVFDSGAGGLSVLAELQRALPQEDVLYLADTAHVPYGARSDEDIRDLTARAVAELVRRGVKAVVVACNTASAFSLTHLRERFELPIIGLVPAVKPAVAATKSGVVGVLATPGTLRGTLLADVIRQWAEPAGVRVMQAVSTELVPLVEAGKADSPEARVVLRDVLEPLAEAGADQLVLGCTHYPFLAGSIRAEFGDTFALVDSGAAVARHTRNVLSRGGLLRGGDRTGEVSYLTTSDPAHLRALLMTLRPGGADGASLPDPPSPRIELTTT
ncbi:glutamate racemase [Deinococcus radiodurans]|jgi:glutamate racemase (EC 5.1.1.3)|uniref:Glutamate racemase n=1 Tax=Deinococcus radiodurans (strain ATCC 13939 / DSM 20539 / JCM 16871 / CCUG 27074 / LMG 4051 / NBRC 15346 / NCIMB 9279 / VKM B-1422 / R1) TaxID=243230 RepID=MURI_DEIRA|nr:RecName: Full=Glutamate racemase [Deinococcus radiodurans R1 = ATCC 13939 = DSM 20539]QIP29578.1 glutamate racemase [Deinococcus radiodurans]UID70563.1 glutamate racemase [Deinococcus radiodurans R1 = ATCC 13939 = DSM 20539]